MRALACGGGKFKVALHFGRSGGWESRECGSCRESGSDFTLGCLKYHGPGKCECPEHRTSAIAGKHDPSWKAVYRSSDGKASWDVGCESIACPVSVITPESQRAVRRFFEARRTAKLGGALYGPDANEWPVRWVETVTLLQYEIEKEEAKANQAIAAASR